jgi:hypothetical protein
MHSMGFSTLVLLAVVAVLSLFIAYAARSLERQIGGDPGYASDVAARIATGDLSANIATRAGDTGSLIANMKAMRDSLVKTIHGITSSADNVAVAAKEIASGNLDLSQRTEQQAASLGETASSMDQITAMVKHTADNAKRATELASDAASVTDRGGATVSEVVETMRDISSQSHKMVEIIAVIEGAQRGRGSGTRRRARPRFCGGGRRSTYAGAAQRNGSQGNSRPDPDLSGQDRHRLDPGRKRWHHDEGSAGGALARIGHHSRNRNGGTAAKQRHPPDHPGGGADGRSHATKRGAGRTSLGGGTIAGRTSRAPALRNGQF